MELLNRLNKVIKAVLVVVFLILAGVVALGIFSIYVEDNYKDYKVTGSAMAPALTAGETITTNRHVGVLKRGDIVAFNPPQSKDVLVERIVALGGEKIVINHDQVTVYNSAHPNGFNPDSNYLSHSVATPGNISLIVPQGKVYILGDNRTVALDSRVFGPIAISSVVGLETGIVK